MLSSPLPAAAHAGAREVVLGPPRSATAVAVTRAAVILAVPGRRPVTVAGADAVRLPGSLVLPAPAARLDLGAVEPGALAEVGGGTVRVGTLVVRPSRWWATPRVRAAGSVTRLRSGLKQLDALLSDAPAPGGGTLGRALPAATTAFTRALTPALRSALANAHEIDPTARDRCLEAARSLLGLGPGLTPSGDDVLAAVLVTVCHLLPDLARVVADIGEDVAALARSHTAPVSAALLSWAACGEGVPGLLTLVDAVGQGGDVTATAENLLRVGHSSGRDLSEGVRAGVRVSLDLLRVERVAEVDGAPPGDLAAVPTAIAGSGPVPALIRGHGSTSTHRTDVVVG